MVTKTRLFFDILVFRLQGFPDPPRTTVEINHDGEGGGLQRGTTVTCDNMIKRQDLTASGTRPQDLQRPRKLNPSLPAPLISILSYSG